MMLMMIFPLVESKYVKFAKSFGDEQQTGSFSRSRGCFGHALNKTRIISSVKRFQ